MKIPLRLSVCLTLGLGACVGNVQNDIDGGAMNTGEGGATGDAGTRGAGGQIGAGGAPGSAGASGAGGAPGSGGVTGSGGMTGSGGRSGTGGSGTGGAPAGTGGSNSVGGSNGAGGRNAVGGSTGSGGTPGLGPWTTGYVATMYGNDTSGDCAGYPNFGDMTSIRSATCSRVVTVAGFVAGTANNASFYGATGDLSSLWVGARCSCNGSDTCPANQSPSCPAEQQSGGNCGICVAVKCDAMGTFSLGGATHDQDCNRTQYAVVQIIDACPHDHPTNVASSEGWCTTRQANHVDLSCSALGGISTKGMNIGQDGWLNVDVQQVDCSVGLGLHLL
jgi:hypothetical protein